MDVLAELAQCALRGVAVAHGAAAVERGGCQLELVDRAVFVAELGQRPAGDGAGQGGLDRHADGVGELGRLQRLLCGCGGVAAGQGDGGGRAGGHRGRRAQADRRGAGLGAGSGGLRFLAAAERQPAAGHQLEQIGAPDAGDGVELLGAQRLGEDGGGPVGLARIEQRDGQDRARLGRR